MKNLYINFNSLRKNKFLKIVISLYQQYAITNIIAIPFTKVFNTHTYLKDIEELS